MPSEHKKPPSLQTQKQAAQQTTYNYLDIDTYPKKTARAENAEIQTKLTVGAPNDVYEQEADRVADQVMSMPDATQQPIQREAMPEEEEIQTKPLVASITPLVQREAMPEEEEEVQTKPSGSAAVQLEAMPEEEEVQTKPLNNLIQREAMPEEEEIQTKQLGNATLQREEEEEIQTKRSPDAGFQVGNHLESRLNSSQGGGSPLSDEVRSFMEPRFGADFSQVRVHTGNEAVQMNQDLNAQAFTHKQDVYFGAGKAPAKDALTAHELTHVVQQTSQKVQPLLQRDDDEPSKAVELKYETVWLPIDLKDKDGKLISTQSVNLQLSLAIKAPLNTTAGGFKFSFLKPQLSLALGAAFANSTGTTTDITKSLSGEGSISIVGVKISGLSKFLPGTKVQVGGKLTCEADIDTLKVETKVEPNLVIKIPVLGSTYINLEGTPSGLQGGLGGNF